MAEGELVVDSKCFQKVLCNPSLLMATALDTVKTEYFSTKDENSGESASYLKRSKGIDRSKPVTVL